MKVISIVFACVAVAQGSPLLSYEKQAELDSWQPLRFKLRDLVRELRAAKGIKLPEGCACVSSDLYEITRDQQESIAEDTIVILEGIIEGRLESFDPYRKEEVYSRARRKLEGLNDLFGKLDEAWSQAVTVPEELKKCAAFEMELTCNADTLKALLGNILEAAVELKRVFFSFSCDCPATPEECQARILQLIAIKYRLVCYNKLLIEVLRDCASKVCLCYSGCHDWGTALWIGC